MTTNYSPIAKITRPHSSGVLTRKRLMTVLNKSFGQPITWISGPAGSGKTTLAANYLDERKLPCLWYQVDAGDADIASFFYYLGLAAQKAAPRYRKPLPLLTPEYLQGMSVFTQRFFENLYSRLKPPFAIVFDNYQEAPEQSPLHDLMNIGLSLIPQGIHVFVLSRNDPPPSFTRLRVNNVMQVVGWNELRFTLEESKQIIRRKDKRKLTVDAIEELHKRTAGWAAGLVLLTEGAGTLKSGTQSIDSHLQPEVFNYFAGEVFDKLDSETRDFLLMTAVLPGMTVRTADNMTDQDNAGRILAGLNRNHFFTEKHQTADPSYQYHPLFREFLLMRMKESLNPEGVMRVQNRAAALLEEAGRIEEAVGLFIEAADWSSAMSLFLNHAATLISQGRGQTLEGWLSRLPRELIDGSPWALYWLGICRMAFNPRESRTWLEKSFEMFRANNEMTGTFLSWASIVDTFIYEWGDFSPLDHWIAVMEELLLGRPSFPSPEIEVRVAAGMLSAMTNRQPGRADLRGWAERVERILFSSSNVPLRLLLGNHLMFYYFWVGDFSKAALVIEAARPSGGLKEYDPLTMQNWHCIEAMYSWFAADWATCKRALDNGVKNAADSGIHLLDLYLMAQGVFGGLSLGDPIRAESCLNTMLRINSPRLGDKALYQYQASSVAWYHDDYKKSAEHGKQGVKITEEMGWPIAIGLCLTELAITLCDDGFYDEVEALLAKATKTCRGLTGMEFLISLNGASFAFHRGREEQGLVLLERGLALGARYGFVNMPRWNDATMSRLCAKALEHNIETEYVQKLIRTRRLVPDGQVVNWPYPIKIHTLGGFELIKDGGPVKFSGKVQQKPLALLKALIAFGGKDVAEEHFTDALWPDADGDLAHRSFEMTVHRLRKLIGDDKVIQLQERRLTLDVNLCWVDVLAFEEAIERAEYGVKSVKGAKKETSEINLALFEKPFSLYKGHFLPSDSVHPWVLSYRERLRSKFMRLVVKLGNYREEAMQWKEAADVFQKGIEVDDRAEEFYQHLMLCHHQLGQRAEAVTVYHRCSALLSSTLGIAPSPRTEELYQTIKNG